MRRVFSHTLRRLVIACAVAAGAGTAGAVRAQGVDPEVLPRVVAAVPGEAEMVVLLRDPVGLLQANETAGPLAQATQVGVLRGFAGSWRVLARELGMEPEAALRRLAGSGVAFVSFGGGADRWAVVGVVDAATARVVREHLKALPRAIVGGQPVLSVENGKYALIARPVVALDENSAHVLAVAPWGQDVAVLEKIAAAVAGGGEARVMGSTRAWRESEEKGAADLLIFARGGMLEFGGAPSKIPGEGHEWERNVVIRGELRPPAWRLEYRRSPALADAAVARALPDGCGRIFDKLSAGASVAVVDRDAARLRQVPFGAILGAGVLESGDGVYALGVRARGAGEDMGVQMPGKGTSELVVAGCYDGAAAAAKDLDRRAAAMVAAVGDDGAKVDPAGLAWLPASSQRATMMRLEAGMPLMPIVGERVCAAWWMYQEAGRREAWDVWMFEPGTELEARVRRPVVEGYLTVGAGVRDERMWLTRAVVRPRMFIEGLHPTMAMALSAFGVCEEARYEAWVGEGGRLEAVVEVRWVGK